MGLFDKLQSKLASMAPDNAAMITAALEPGDVLHAHALVTPAGADTARTRDLMNSVINAVSEKVSKNRWIEGEPGSIARSLPTEAGTGLVMAITDHGVSFWDFGLTRREQADAPEYRITRAHVVSLVDSGTRIQGGGSIWRMTFTDGSSFGYRVTPLGEGFAEAAAGLSRG